MSAGTNKPNITNVGFHKIHALLFPAVFFFLHLETFKQYASKSEMRVNFVSAVVVNTVALR